jgi:cytochrome c553
MTVLRSLRPRHPMSGKSKAMAKGLLFVLFGLLSLTAYAASSVQSEIDAVLRRKPDLVDGERRYEEACSRCHGAAGEGQPKGMAPRIAGQRYSVLVAELVGYRHGRRMDGQMQARAAEPVLAGPQDVANVAAYIAQLRAEHQGRGPGMLREAGGRIFAGRCTSCHGVGGAGSDQPAVPRVAMQNYNYLLRQLHDLAEGRRPAAARDHLEQLKSLDDEQIAALADHLSWLP